MHSKRVNSALRHLAANVRLLRRKNGWTQEELAEAADLAPRYVQTLESERANPRAAVIIQVADALKVEPGDLFLKAQLPAKKTGRPKKV